MRAMRTLLLAVLVAGCGSNSPSAVAPIRQAATAQSPISYHGGWVMYWDPAVYLIYYGGWDAQSPVKPILEDFVNNVGGSNWFNINTKYTDSSGNHATARVHLAGTATDNYSRGKQLTDGDVRYIVENAIYQGKLADDPWGIYVVVPTSDVGQGNFCTTNCGFHTYTQWGSDWYTYIFVGNPNHCPNVCVPYSPSPNGAPDGDEMVNILAHELAETVTDPYVDAWYDAQGEENADKCAWTFGTMWQTSTGAYANVHLGARDYLVQRNWVPGSPGQCALSL
jgi:hypothetical protein